MPRFEKGKPGGPGRPPGLRNKTTQLLDTIAKEGTERVIRTVQDKAEKGDMYAAALMLARTWPRRKGRPVEMDLPSVADTGGLVAAQAAVVAAMARGTLSPDEAVAVSSVLEIQRRAIETHDHERRISELENRGAPPAPEPQHS